MINKKSLFVLVCLLIPLLLQSVYVYASPNCAKCGCWCTDHDGGLNYYQKSYVNNSHSNWINTTLRPDTCTGTFVYDEVLWDTCLNGQILKEYRCLSNGWYGYVNHTCQYGCRDDACLREGVDSDTCYLKTVFYGGYNGCCPSTSDCLVQPNGQRILNNKPLKWFDYEDVKYGPRCITNDQYILDKFCENGEWTTRTSYVATQLLHEVKSRGIDNFTLFCGNYDEALNYYQEVIGNIGPNSCTYGNANKQFNCLNDFCVLTAPDENLVAFGSSLNPGMSVENLTTMLGYNKECGSDQDGQFHRCGINGNLWYNSKYKLFIYGEENNNPIVLNGFNNWRVEHNSLLKEPYEDLMTEIYGYPIEDQFVIDIVEKSHQYNSIYLSNISSKSVLARKETLRTQDYCRYLHDINPDSAGAYGYITDGDRSHQNGMRYTFPAFNKNLTLRYKLWDVEGSNECVNIKINGKTIKTLKEVTNNNEWSKNKFLRINKNLLNKDSTNVLVFEHEPCDGEWAHDNTWWGVKDVYLMYIEPECELVVKTLLVIKYENFETNICSNEDIPSDNCESNNGIYYLSAQQGEEETSTLFDIWPELTAGLRIS